MMTGFDFTEQPILAEEQKSETKKPHMYKVLFHNDDYTSMEFVVFVLRRVFHKSLREAIEIMWRVHTKEVALVGIYTYEIAATGVERVHELAENFDYPFLATIEKVEK